MKDISKMGGAVGLATWLGLVVATAFSLSCAEFKGCGRGDLVVNSLISAGMVWPAWIVAVAASCFLPDKKKKS